MAVKARPKGPGTTRSASNSRYSIRIRYRFSAVISSKLGPRLKIVALIDPNVTRAKEVLQKKRATFVRSAYEDTRVYATLDEFIKDMNSNQAPCVFVVGSPPMFRGSTQSGRNVEMQIVKHFPGVALFVEKPVATGPSSEIGEAFKVAKFINKSGIICSVGYVAYRLCAGTDLENLRYHAT